MIQSTSPITNQYSEYKSVSFKKTTFNNDVLTTKADTPDNFEKKILEQNERMILISGIQALVLLVGGFLFNLKMIIDLTKKKAPDTSAIIRQFESLKNNAKIPDLENCKSMNKELKAILQRQINYINAGKQEISESGNPQNTNRLLLYGPTGVGKSFFAKVFAKSIDAEYMEILYSDINSQWAGEASENMKNVFEEIIKTTKKNPNKKYVVTLNEIDSWAVPPENLSHSSGSHWITKLEERSVFLNYMEKLKEEVPNVIIVGTTNITPQSNGLDRATLSRFQNITKVSFPDKECLFEALKYNLDGIKNKDKFISENEQELKQFAETIANRKYSFRNLEYIVNEAKGQLLDESIGGNSTEFKVEYLKKANTNLKISDGEMYK